MDISQVLFIALAVFILPGFLLNLISGLRLPWALLGSIPVSFGIYGLASWLIGLTPGRFDIPTISVVFAGFLGLGIIWRLLARRFLLPPEIVRPGGEPAQELPWWRRTTLLGLADGSWVLPGLGALSAIFLLATRALKYLKESDNGGVESIFQGWDVHWHASVVQFIELEGIASPTRMGELQNIETQAFSYYPTAWHAGVWVFKDLAHISVIESINLAGVLLPTIGLPLSVGLLAWKLVGNRGLTAQLAAALAPLGVLGVPALYWVGYYVGFWPYLTAVAFSGVVLALFMSVPERPVRIFAAALSLTGIVQLHPASATIVVLGLGLWWLGEKLWRPSAGGAVKARVRDFLFLAVAGIAGVLLIAPQILVGARQTEEVNAFSATEDLTRSESWWRAIELQTRHTEEWGPLDVTWLLIFAAIGALVLAVWRRNIWGLALWALSLAITVNALLPFDNVAGKLLGIVGGLHYNTAHRLIMPVAMLTIAAAAIGIVSLVRLITAAPLGNKVPLWWWFSAVVSVAATGVIGYGVVVHADKEISKADRWAIASARDGRMVDDYDLKAFDWLATQPRAYEGHIFGTPADGHGWMYAYNGLPSISRHYAWPISGYQSDTEYLDRYPSKLGAGNDGDPDAPNRVDQAARDLKVNYIYVSPGNFWNFQPTLLRQTEGLWFTPGVTPIYHDHQVSIFAVNDAFSDKELKAMRAPGNSPEPLPPLPVDEDGKTIFHRPAR